MGSDVAVIGSGVCGALVARELVEAGHEVTLIERGGLKTHAEQLVDEVYELDIPTARHNHESHPETPGYPWDYLYGVGGTSMHWTGVTPRFLPSDLELRSRYGVGRDWPIDYRELAPFYVEAERALAVAGGENELFDQRAAHLQPPHPYAPVDRLVAPLLGPYFTLPQARPTQVVDGRAACCGSARCRLCPVDARYSSLHTLETLRRRPNLKLVDRTVVARLRMRGGRVDALECIRADGERTMVRAGTFVLAANGIENAAILLRSGFDDPDLGRWLFDHEHRVLEIGVDRPTGHGRGSSLATGISYAYADGESRSRRGGLLVYPYNPGLLTKAPLVQALASGRSGRDMRRQIERRFERTLVLDTIAEDLPRRDRYVELSPNRDGLGLPLNRIHYPVDSEYVQRARRFLTKDLEARLRPLRGRLPPVSLPFRGGHQLGTCYMGEREGVVDPDQRHHRVENLYLSGGSSFPTYSAAHPTLTIAALAIRLGRHLSRA